MLNLGVLFDAVLMKRFGRRVTFRAIVGLQLSANKSDYYLKIEKHFTMFNAGENYIYYIPFFNFVVIVKQTCLKSDEYNTLFL